MRTISEVVNFERLNSIQFLIRKVRRSDVLKSSAGLLMITLLVKVLGYVEKLVLAYFYGTSYQVDAYTTVLAIVLAVFYFFREIVEPGFLNTFLIARDNGNEKAGWNLFNKGIRIILLITFFISVLAIIFPDKVVNVFAPGFRGEKLSLCMQLIQIAIPAIIFLSLSTLTSITLNGLKMFALPASGELVFKALIIVCMAVFFGSYGITGAAIGILAGSAGRLGIHLIKLGPKVNFHPVHVDQGNRKRLWVLTWPLLLGVSFSQISTLIDNGFASYLQEGAISALNYSKKIVDLPVIIFPYILSVVVFPYFSKLVVEKDKQRLSKLFSESLQWIILIFLPVSIFFFAFSTPIVEVILQRGAFNAASTLLTAKPLAIYSLGLVFFAIETILVIFYYANADTKTPVFVGIGCVILNIILTYVFIQFIGYLGIALAFVIQKMIKNIVLLLLLKHKIEINMNTINGFLLKVIGAGTVFSLIVTLTKLLMINKFNTGALSKAAFLLLSFMLAGAFYVFGLYYMKVFKPQKVEEPD